MLEGFSWLQEHSVAYCVTFAQGLDETELLRRFAGDLSRAQLIQQNDWQALNELSRFGDVIRVGWCDGWAFVYEENGNKGTLPETLHTVSEGTVAISVYYGINATKRFCYAKDRTIVADFNPIDTEYSNAMPEVLALLREGDVAERPWDKENENNDYDDGEAMFNLAEAVGIRLTQEAIAERPLLSSFIRNPFSDFVGDLLSRGSDEQTISHLLNLLNDWEQRERLLHFLEESGQTESQLLETMRVLSALQSIQSTPPLLKVLEEGTEKVRSAASELLKTLIRFDQMHDQEGVQERLLFLTSAPEPAIALQATIALGTLGDQRAIKPLLLMLSLYPHEREAVKLLGQFRTSSAVEALLNLLNPQDKSIDFQRDLLKALAEIGGAQVFQQLMPMLDPASQETSFQQALLASLVQLADPFLVEALLPLLNPSPESHHGAVFQFCLLASLGNLGDHRVVEPLAQFLRPDVSAWPLSSRMFQECLVRTLRQLGDTRDELLEVEASLQRLAATTTIQYSRPMTHQFDD